jgi:sigma-B regulation protein RsbU (phosphoserine phosphatase)
MMRGQHGRLKNCLLLANFVSNLVGVILVFFLIRRLYHPLEGSVLEVSNHVNTVFTPGAFLLIAFLTLLYERPIRRYLDLQYKNESIPAELRINARRKLLNEPFFLIAVDFSMWLLAAIVFSTLFWSLGAGREVILRPIIMNLITGLITVTVAFFVIEHHLQKKLVPHFFPEGGLSKITNTLRIRISTRLIAVLLACNLIPFGAVLSLFWGLSQIQQDPMELIEKLRFGLFTLALVFMATSTWLITLVSSNLSRPFKDIVQVLQGVRKGRFERRVHVTSNDEIGYTGDVINEMTEGLIEREKMQQSLNLAKEVQQNLLPHSNMKINGIDIAGRSIYCDETGGDYYDFFTVGGINEQKIGVVVGDVSGHGIPSALLMASVRSSVRQRAALPGSTARIISDVNRQLVLDVEDSGQFITMFFLVLNTEEKRLEWIRAGHDPAIIYDLKTDAVKELSGPGIALGVDSECIYVDNRKVGISNGQIILLSTDGVWEARDKNGKMLGKEPIRRIIRDNASSDATTILNGIFNSVMDFVGKSKIDDDITAVVIKVQ